MKKYDVIEPTGSIEIENGVAKRITAAVIRGLSMEKAEELWVFKRISMLLTAIHTAACAANRIYSNVDVLLDAFGGRKNEIAKACRDYEKAMDKFFSFWNEYYSKGAAIQEMNEETEALYHNVMKWAMLPENWNLGDPQQIDDDSIEASVVINDEAEGKIMKLYRTVLDGEVHDCHESWCVTKYDSEKQQQICVETGMDKASALMVAKRLSSEDKCDIYTASQVLDVAKNETVVTPTKAFKAGNTIGKISKTIKS